MSITLEQIDLLRKRANVSYQDAKEALEKCNNDIVEALIYLEKEDKVKANKESKCNGKFFDKVKDLIKKGNEIRVIIKNQREENILNLSLNVSIIITIIATPVFVGIAILAALLTKHKIRINKLDNEDLEVNKVFDKVSDAVNSAADSFKEKTKEKE